MLNSAAPPAQISMCSHGARKISWTMLATSSESNKLYSTPPALVTSHLVCSENITSPTTTVAVTMNASATTLALYVAHTAPTSRAWHIVKLPRSIRLVGCERRADSLHARTSTRANDVIIAAHSTQMLEAMASFTAGTATNAVDTTAVNTSWADRRPRTLRTKPRRTACSANANVGSRSGFPAPHSTSPWSWIGEYMFADACLLPLLLLVLMLML
mmetsp:Transcript_43427/g.130261  ORF Transcript_43427/g.130261 Transcript_43427/m.130261 type:complete len:215 (+) Transcript_43427:461-1105(+)